MSDLTPKQQLVYDHLKTLNCARGAYELLEDLRAEGFRMPSQIYRVLNRLLELGLIHKIETLNAFVACDQGHHSGLSVFSVCDECSCTKELSPPDYVNLIEKLTAAEGFRSRAISIEVMGLCAKCSP